MTLVLEPAASRSCWERGKRRLEAPKRLADDLEISTGNGVHECQADELHVSFSLGHALLRPRQKCVVAGSTGTSTQRMFDAPAHAVEQPRGCCLGRTNRAIRTGERVHVLEW